MRAIIRSLIVWMVLLAVPFQGLASAAMPGCAPAAATQHAAASGHHAVMSADDHAHHTNHQATPSGHDANAADHHASKCSNCAACSIGAAMPAGIPAVAVHAPPTLTIPFDAGLLPSVDLAHPERPPRFASA